MRELTAEYAANICGGKIICGKGDAVFNSICIDSRDGIPGALFVALIGETTDGHKYIDSAVKNGCTVVLSQREVTCTSCVILVDDTLKAFHKIAAAYRALFSAKAVGITGSVGKTTTKEFIYAVLNGKYNTLKSQGNFNSETGMPLTAFNLTDEHEMAVFEMGMDAKGEIAALTKIARPDIAVITNIGVMHIEHLGSRKNILMAKLEIERGLRRSGIMVLNGDDDMLWGVRDKLKHKIVYYGIDNKEALYRAENIAFGSGVTTFDMITPVGNVSAKIYTEGRHNVLNALAAVVVGLYSGISLNDCVKYLLDFQNTGMRQNIYGYNGVTIIEDCYNAGPDSMKAALEILKTKPQNRIAVLSDMLELGKDSPKYHTEIGEKCAQCADKLIAYGPLSEYICKGAKEGGMTDIFYCKDSTDAAGKLFEIAAENDTVLFKGSHGMHVEEVLEKYKGMMK